MTGRSLSSMLSAPHRPMQVVRMSPLEPLRLAAGRIEAAWPGRVPSSGADREALVAEMLRRLEAWD